MKPPSDVLDENGRYVRELHGVTLVDIVTYLVERVGYSDLYDQIPINCFSSDPSIKSSLTFLRRTPWARAKVEALYIAVRIDEIKRKAAGEET